MITIHLGPAIGSISSGSLERMDGGQSPPGLSAAGGIGFRMRRCHQSLVLHAGLKRRLGLGFRVNSSLGVGFCTRAQLRDTTFGCIRVRALGFSSCETTGP